MQGAGRAVLAATLLLIAGTLNIINGIGALDGAKVFVGDSRCVFTNLNTIGWVLILLALIQFAGGFSLMVGNTYGKVIGSQATRQRARRTQAQRSPEERVAKHSRAARAAVTAHIEDATLQVRVRDDGVGGAGRRKRPAGPGGPARVLDGRLDVESPADGGTLVAAAIPLAG